MILCYIISMAPAIKMRVAIPVRTVLRHCRCCPGYPTATAHCIWTSRPSEVEGSLPPARQASLVTLSVVGYFIPASFRRCCAFARWAYNASPTESHCNTHPYNMSFLNIDCFVLLVLLFHLLPLLYMYVSKSFQVHYL